MSKYLVKIIPGVLISGLLIFYILKKFDTQHFITKLSNIDIDQIIFLLLLTLLMIIIRAVRWGAISGLAIQGFVSYRVCETISIGALLNSIIPFGAGEIYRIKEMKDIKNTSYGIAASTLIVERMLDMIFLSIIVLFMMYFLPFPYWVRNLLILIGSIISIFTLIIIFVKKEYLYLKIQETKYNNKIMVVFIKFIRNMMQGFSDFKESPYKWMILMMTIIFWLITSTIVFLKGHMFNLDFTFKVVITSMALVNLSAILPATPGMFGSYHLAVATSLGIWGYSKVDCTGYAVFAHGTNYLSMILFGMIFGLIKYLNTLFKSK